MEETSKRPPKLPENDEPTVLSSGLEPDNQIDESLERSLIDTDKTKFFVKAASFCTLTPLVVMAVLFRFLAKSSSISSSHFGFWDMVVGLADFVGALAPLFAALIVWQLYQYLNGYTLQPKQRISMLTLVGAFGVSCVCSLFELIIDDNDYEIIWGMELFSTIVLSAALVFAGIMMLQLEAKSMGRTMLVAAVLTFVVVLIDKSLLKDISRAMSKSSFTVAMLKYLVAWLVSALSLIAVYTSIGKYLGVEFKKED